MSEKPDEAPAHAGVFTPVSAGQSRKDRRSLERANKAARTKQRQHKAGSALVAYAREVAIVLTVAVVMAVGMKTFITQAFRIPTGSMISTIEPGDRVMARRFSLGEQDLRRGDIVVFKDTEDWLSSAAVPAPNRFTRFFQWIGLMPQDGDDHLAKRIIGLPGDRVKCCASDGRIEINGVPVTEPYLQPGVVPSAIDFDVTVPAGRMFVMGDNRPHSADSRAHLDSPFFGTVPIDDVVGVVYLTMWPFERWHVHTNPGNFNQVPRQ
ncbi:signal peptidase I [Buchananella hordeovulneris]|uniref:signal peptidase I n=1 Tax=Buchananella hordeovulneris TaxID=52770 RepID=UPI000A02ED1E|nr:signal peptidase I [Buchananella hordeovulneris]RRD52505.1 signal peptidase I [Buchananella hordeovulneris]